MTTRYLANREKERLRNSFGDWAVISGGSSGIGLELATRLAEAGINLVMNARSVTTLQSVQLKLQKKYNVQIKTVAADVSTEKGVEAIIAAGEKLNVGLFVAAAGFGTSGRLVQADVEEEVNLIRVNCEGLLRLTYHYGKLFSTQKRGGIILLSSMVAFQGVPYSANYAASKAYVQSLAEALAKELKPYNVHVLAAAPGPVASGFAERANMKMNMTLKPSDVGIPILRALGRKSLVLPGLLTKFLVYSLRTLPRWGKVMVMGKVMSGFTKHQEKVSITHSSNR